MSQENRLARKNIVVAAAMYVETRAAANCRIRSGPTLIRGSSSAAHYPKSADARPLAQALSFSLSRKSQSSRSQGCAPFGAGLFLIGPERAEVCLHDFFSLPPTALFSELTRGLGQFSPPRTHPIVYRARTKAVAAQVPALEKQPRARQRQRACDNLALLGARRAGRY